MVAVTPGIRALSGRQAKPSLPQAQLSRDRPKQILTAGHAESKIVRALAVFVATSFMSQTYVVLPLFGGPSMHENVPISQLSMAREADRIQLPSFGRLASDVLRPATRPWCAKKFYQGLPVSQHRSSGQFYVRPLVTQLAVPPASNSWSDRRLHAQPPAPVITIVTATRNPSDLFFFEDCAVCARAKLAVVPMGRRQ